MIGCPQPAEPWPLSQAIRLERADNWEQARPMLAHCDYSGVVVDPRIRPENWAETMPPIIAFPDFERLRELRDGALLVVWLQALAENQRLESAFQAHGFRLAALESSLTELVKEQELNLQVFHDSSAASLILGRNGCIQAVNQRAAEILARSQNELLGLSLLTCLKEGSVASMLKFFWACLRGEKCDPIRVNVRLKEGASRPVELIGRASDIGGTCRLHLSLQDARESPLEEQAATILDQMSDGLLSVDENGQIVGSNKSAQNLLGYSVSDLAGLGLNGLGIGQRIGSEAQPIWLNHSSGAKLLAEVKTIWQAGSEHASQVVRLRDLSGRRKALQDLMEIRESQLSDLGQELHDDLGQVLTALTYLAEILSDNLRKRPSLESLADEVVLIARQCVGKTRSLARSLYPAVLERNGLASALQDLANSTEDAFLIKCDCRASQVNLPRDQALHLFRIAQAALNNSVQHSGATRIQLKLHQQREPPQVSLEIHDDGRGIRGRGRGSCKGNGITDMEHRCEAIQATLLIQSPPGQGTSVICRVPVGGRKRP